MLTGKDRLAYLQGLLTNDIAALTPGTGCYAAFLTPQGRMISDLRVVDLGDATLLDLPASTAGDVRSRLERFIFSEDVHVEDVTNAFGEIGVYGPDAARVVASILPGALDVEALDALRTYEARRTQYGTTELIVIRSDEPGIGGFDLVVARDHVSPLRDGLLRAGAAEADEEAVERVRIESGRPRFGVDMDHDTIPLEAGIEERAISRTKGCYVGQEVIIRVIDRGHGRVARRLVGLAIEGATVPSPADVIVGGEREIGRVTSAVLSPALGRPIALGYVHRDFVQPGTPVQIAHATGRLVAQVAALPFVKGASA